MQINEPRGHYQTGAVHHLSILGNRRTLGGNLATKDEDVSNRIPLVGRIDHPAIFKECVI